MQVSSNRKSRKEIRDILFKGLEGTLSKLGGTLGLDSDEIAQALKEAKEEIESELKEIESELKEGQKKSEYRDDKGDEKKVTVSLSLLDAVIAAVGLSHGVLRNLKDKIESSGGSISDRHEKGFDGTWMALRIIVDELGESKDLNKDLLDMVKRHV